MSTIQHFLQPHVLAAIAKKLVQSMILSMIILLPGIVVTAMGFKLVGSLLLLLGGFVLVARNYSKPWRLNAITPFIPAVASIGSLLIQTWLVQASLPGLIWVAMAALVGAIFGWSRARSHRLFFKDNKLMAEKTIYYLLVWAASSVVVHLVGLSSSEMMVSGGLLTAIFSTAMLTSVAVILYQRSRIMQNQGIPSVKSTANGSLARASSLAVIILAVISTNHANAIQDDALVTKMVDVGKNSIQAAAKQSSGLIEQRARMEKPVGGDGTSLIMNADFDVQLDTYVTDTSSRIEFTKYSDRDKAKKTGAAAVDQLKKKVNGKGATLRGESSISVEYTPQTGGVAHRAIIHQGNWVIDVDTIAWDPGNVNNRETLSKTQAKITQSLAESLFDNGVATGLIDLSPEPMEAVASTESVAASPGPANTVTATPGNTEPAPSIVNLDDFVDQLPEELLTPEEIATAATLITLILIAAGFSADTASAFASAMVESLQDQQLDEMADEELNEDNLAELEEGLARAEEVVEPEIIANGLSETKPQAQGTVGWTDRQVISEALEGMREDAITAALEVRDIYPVVSDAVSETLDDLQVIDSEGLDWDKIDGIKEDIDSAREAVAQMVGNLSQLAGDAFATNIDQDPNVLAAIELLTILSRRQAVPGSSILDQSDETLQQLLTERRDEVIAGLERIGEMAGKGGFEAARLAIGAQEWENAVNGDLSPLTRIGNALLASTQTATLLHGAGSSIASRFADDGVAYVDDAARVPGYMDEMADGARPRQPWPWQSRRNPETGKIEFRANPDEPFRPLPDDVAESMRNQRIGDGEFRMNPDTGDVEWRNPETHQIEKAPLSNDVRPGYEQSANVVATGRDAGLRNLPDGAVIPDEFLPQTGYAPKQIDELARLAGEEKVIFAGRTTNMDSLRHIAEQTGTPKPVSIKSKTIQELDVYLGAQKNDVGLVGLFEPKMPDTKSLSPELAKRVRERFDLRMSEFNELSSEIKKLPNVEMHDGKVWRVFDDGKKLPFAGDIDPVYIRDAKTGKVLTGDRYQKVLEKFQKSGAEVQHGSEFNMSADLLRNHKPGTPEYQKAVEKMAKLHAKLGKGHTSGAEIVVEMWPDGKLRRAGQQRWLGMEV